MRGEESRADAKGQTRSPAESWRNGGYLSEAELEISRLKALNADLISQRNAALSAFAAARGREDGKEEELEAIRELVRELLANRDETSELHGAEYVAWFHDNGDRFSSILSRLRDVVDTAG